MLESIFTSLKYNKFLHNLVIFCMFFSLLLFNLLFRAPGDFCQDYYAASNILGHHFIYSHLPCPGMPYNPHPPVAILFFLPFVFLPLPFASLVWNLFSFSCYISAGLLLLYFVDRLSWEYIGLFLGISLIWPSLWYATNWHNLIQVLVFLVTLSLVLKKINKLYLSGIVLGIASLIKIWPVMLLVGCLFTHQIKRALAGSITIISGIIISIILFTPHAISAYLGPIRAYEENWVFINYNLSLFGVLTKLFSGYRNVHPLILFLSPSVVIHMGYCIAVVAFIIVALFVSRYQRGVKTREVAMITEGIFLSLAMLLFPVIWDFNYVILMIPALYILLLIQSFPKLSWVFYILFVFGLLVIYNPELIVFFLIARLPYVAVYFYLFLTSGIISFIIAQLMFLRKIAKPDIRYTLIHN